MDRRAGAEQMKNCLYLSYDGLLDPLGYSQVIPYIECLVAAGHSFTVISYEKEHRSNEEILSMQRRLGTAGVEWLRLPFKVGKWEIVKRIISGITAVRTVCRRTRPDIVHLRGLIPAVIYKLSLSRVPYLYDFRGFAIGEWTDIGKIGAGSLAHRVLQGIDRSAVESACGIVVLEKAAEALLRRTYRVPNVPLKVIRTCTDIALYLPRKDRDAGTKRSPIQFVHLGGASRPYRPDLALKLISQLLNSGLDCRVDFLNERDHADIAAAAVETDFPRDRMTVLGLDQKLIPHALQKYDAGLVFLDTSPWRRVCSPTKIGEYLAAGLPVVSLDGIDVLEQLAASTRCVEIVNREELLGGIASATIDRLAAFIFRPGLGIACQELARRECSLDMAGQLYAELYAEIEARR